MFTPKELRSLTSQELLDEHAIVNEYLDKLVGLNHALESVQNGCSALSAIYAGQKGQEVFMMALDVVEHSTEKRIEVVTARAMTVIAYVDNIIELLGFEPASFAEWPSHEVLVEEYERSDPSFKHGGSRQTPADES